MRAGFVREMSRIGKSSCRKRHFPAMLRVFMR
jgi:hypothetical protein